MGDLSLLDLMGDTGQAPKPIAGDAASEPSPEPQAPDTPKTEHCELELVLHYDNEIKGAIHVSRNGNLSAAVWLQKSQIQFTPVGRNAPATTNAGNPVVDGMAVIIVNIPEWLAKEKGLI